VESDKLKVKSDPEALRIRDFCFAPER